jgi:hypothetical protein
MDATAIKLATADTFPTLLSSRAILVAAPPARSVAGILILIKAPIHHLRYNVARRYESLQTCSAVNAQQATQIRNRRYLKIF